MKDSLLQTKAEWDSLLDRLEGSSAVQRYGQDEARTLVHAFADIESSARRFLQEQLPRLVSAKTKGAALDELLFEIREEFRHMLYHMHDPQFFRVVEPTHDWLTLSVDLPGRGEGGR